MIDTKKEIEEGNLVFKNFLSLGNEEHELLLSYRNDAKIRKWMFDDSFEKVAYTYCNSGAIIESENGTYADKSAEIKKDYVGWNHGLSEVLNSLISNGLEMNSLNEFDYSPYNCFQNTIEVEPKKFRIKHLDNKIPMVYSILATKKM